MAKDENLSDEAPSWKFKEEFGIVKEMKKAVELTKEATEKELESLRRKLERLTYGS
jgi:hypothetical protein